jgi:hypothetical protein
MLRRVLFALALALLPAALVAQSPAEAAEREKRRRQKQKASPSPTFTNDDLAKAGGSASPKPSPGASAAPAAGTAGSEGDSARGSEAEWRERAAGARAGIKAAEGRIQKIQERLNALMVDTSPTNLGDPNRLQTLEAEKAKAREELDKATRDKQSAQKALEDLQEEARRKLVPPGWLREP